MMFQRMFIFVFITVLPLFVFGVEYKCKEHPYKLTLKEVGYEQVNHRLYIDNVVLVKELADEMWFTDDVKCTVGGFHITVSHRQYNELKSKFFILRPYKKDTIFRKPNGGVATRIEIDYILNEDTSVIEEKECYNSNHGAIQCLDLAGSYYNGYYGKPEYKKALALYTQSCKYGLDQGCSHAARMYANGIGVKKNKKKAKIFFDKASKNIPAIAMPIPYESDKKK